ncbi:poly [ADP-ribose] polymerase [Trypanosoma rangeli]|uniref:Poly [ADP-ribose] polymerase n=1 Tax=Trypanosoma rangeli TaxID=5698 RepID=A0A3R7KL50_TRYRA|nr:poly [ADP-ribose] polymerase [Trypanosoma rangeli]RNF03647.1 poly [ADP-ribose] polymerase [Trypanosoma rangeli]|eukprot:RNF03647.1 poly [ADP-ribose] polymerase [Trypanosoma rangeli]
MSSVWKVLVRLHNIVNIPRDVCAEDGFDDARVFFVVARAVSGGGIFFTNCPEVTAKFTTRDIARTSAGDVLEVKFDGRDERCAAEWSTSAPTLELILLVREQLQNSVRVVGSNATNLVINIADVVQRRKLVTHLVGTGMGQVGVSLAVTPSDIAGYRRRLTEFLAQYNPGGLQLVDGVVRSIPEVDTFTKLYRKYGLIDYERRIRDFFRVYGREHATRIPSLLQEWENREEELLHSLVIDNGPEPDTIDTETRLAAFLKAHNLSAATPDVARAVREFGEAPRKLFEALTMRYGPEPDPRGYLFPPTQYESPRNPRQTRRREVEPFASAVEKKLSPLRGTLSSGSAQQPVEETWSPQQRTSPVIESVSHVGPTFTADTASNAGWNHSYSKEESGKSLDYDSSGDALWVAFCEALRRHGQRPSDVYYMNKAAFNAAVEKMGYTNREREVLSHHWEQRLRAAVREENLTFSDPYCDTVRSEVLNLVGLQELNLEVVAVTTVANSEHASCFASRLSAAHQRTTERLAIVGECHRLRDIVVRGVGGDTVGEPLPRENPCAVFYRRPFQNWNRRQATTILVCDVVIGRPFVCPPQEKTMCAGTADFLKEWDCCVFHDSGGGQAVAVYDPKQVLPRYMVQCHVDVTITPCQAHPSRAVEYYAVEKKAFVCSRCVVLGAYRQEEVLAIEDAAVQARLRLSDYRRDVHQLVADLAVRETELSRELDEMRTAPKRLEVEREVERIRREAEERVAAILRAMEQSDVEQRSDLQLRQKCVLRVKEAAGVLDEALTAALQHTNPLQLVGALQHMQAEEEVQYLRSELQRSCNRLTDTDSSGAKVFATQAVGSPVAIRQYCDATTTASAADTRTRAVFDHNDNQQKKGIDPSVNSHHSHMYSSSSSAVLPSHPTKLQQSPMNVTRNSLYAKYIAIASGAGKEEGEENVEAKEETSRPQLMILNVNNKKEKGGKGCDVIRAMGASPGDVVRRAKEAVTKGWALYRQGDAEGARCVWNDVHERHLDSAVGARARAYILEALDRDYEAAAAWYDVSLKRDPSDVMTLYNYGVLLETLLGQREEALMLFERAHALGDGAAGRRAQQLRVSLGKA